MIPDKTKNQEIERDLRYKLKMLNLYRKIHA
jgi:hypothetical protein